MVNFRLEGVSHIYLDEKLDGFSNIGAGLLIRALGHSLKVAYVDVMGKSSKLSNFIENLSLNKSFIREFYRINVDMYSFKSNDRISKALIPLVEFNTINREIFLNSLNNYDLVIFDNFDLSIISIEELNKILSQRNQLTELVFILKDKFQFKNIKSLFDIVSIYNYKINNGLIVNKNILNIFGNGRGKSIYSFGYIIRNFILKKDIKLIYFDKGDGINGEIIFFTALKKWSKLNNLYGKFDFVINGAKRYVNHSFRKENLDVDVMEAKEALMLLKTSLKFQTPVIADELGKVINEGILDKDKVLEVINGVKNELLITGTKFNEELNSISNLIIEIEDLKKIENLGLKKGIDF